jgi:fermentation-respiration switch protein FrsA (DUF1100 family)
VTLRFLASATLGLSIVALPAATTQGARQTQAPPIDFDHESARPPDIRDNPAPDPQMVRLREITYAGVAGRNKATLVTPPAVVRGPHAAVLFVHWYGPPSLTSNRSQFVEEAIELGRLGTVSLLIDTPWSEHRWFPTRDSSKDYAFSVNQVKEIRRALDVLLAQPEVDRSRAALVGHDFGAMYGVVAAAGDPRVTMLVYIAGTRSFTDWFLYSPKREGADREAFIATLAPLDPVKYLPDMAPRPVLLQFGTSDPHVSTEAARALADATREPKVVKTYDAGHELNHDARRDRLTWLEQGLGLEEP